jgi:Protein of unknown function (DUF1501)
VAGGDLRTGRAIGSTDRAPSQTKNRSVHFQKVIATQYRCLDIDPNRATLPDPIGRPHSLIDQSGPINELR